MSDQETPEGGAMPSDANASPEVPATEVETEAKGSEADSSPAAPDPGEKTDKPKKDGKDVRIDELTRRYRESERRVERLMRMLEQPKAEPERAQPQPEADRPKTLADFQYNDAKYSEYLLERATKTAAQVAEQKAKREREEQAEAARRQSWDERFEKFAEEHPEILDGWDEVPISQGVGRALQTSELGPEIGLHLKNNPALALKLSKLDPIDAAREVGRIEERLEAARKKAAEKPVSEAPPPPPKLDAKTASDRISTTSPESDRLSDEEWFKAEQARLKRKSQRARA